VAETVPDLVAYDDQGEPLTVKYHMLGSMLLNELKKQNEQLEEQKAAQELHARESEDLRTRFAALENRMASSASAAALPADRK
jgi:uncharacterized protein YigA (DUF484 family)